MTQRAEDIGLASGELAALVAPIETAQVEFAGGDPPSPTETATASITGFAIFVAILGWGQYVMMGVTEEKASRVIEVVLGHTTAKNLLTGKVLGNGLIALSQLLILVAGLAGAGLLLLGGSDEIVTTELLAVIPVMIALFLAGFAFYACLYAAAGSLISRQEDASGIAFVVTGPLIIGWVLVSASLSIGANPALTIGSLIPFTSPVALPARMAMEPVPFWQVALAVLVLAVCATLTLRFAARLMRFSLLQSGSRLGLRSSYAAAKSLEADSA